MSFQKIFTKISLSLAAFFWAGCGDSSSKSVEYEPVDSSDSDECKSDACMIRPLYGVEPVYDFSSSSVDRAAAIERGETLCVNEGGLKETYQYQPEWGTPEWNADQVAHYQVQDSARALLNSDAAKSFSEKKKRCLEEYANLVTMVALYGSPLPDDENPYDAWTYTCKNGKSIADDATQKLDKEYNDAYDAAKKISLEKYRKEVDECDN